MRIPSLCALALLGAVGIASAQPHWPENGTGPYNLQPHGQANLQQGCAQPSVQQGFGPAPYYGFPRLHQHAMLRAQATDPTYGYYSNPAYPPSSYYLPPMHPNMYFPGVPAGGWNFNYTPPNPILPSQSAYTVPIYAPPLRVRPGLPPPTAIIYPLPNENPPIYTK